MPTKRKPPAKQVIDREHLAKLMKARNLSQGQLAKATGLYQAHISMLLSGEIEVPTYGTLRALAKALKTSIETLTRSEKANEREKKSAT
jgi:transcriptional regulator with XRE-family HTH domain